MSTNTDKIEKIIAIRRQRVNGLKQKFEFLKKAEIVIEQFNALKTEVDETEKTGKGRFKPVLDKNQGLADRVLNLSIDSLLTKIKEQIRELDFLIRRFSRESIQISVVGKAGQGKSRLLQAISGLESDVIPVSDGGDCTGTKSVICNHQDAVYAKVIFYTENELIGHVQKYLDALRCDKTIGSISDIGRLKIDTIHASTAGSDSKKEHLKKYIAHLEKYKDNLGQELHVSQKADIRKYVAQYDEKGRPLYHYLAVKEVQIYTPFPYKDAGKTVLVDTIGLGDTSLGIREKMIHTLAYDSDAAIVLRRPDPYRDAIREEDDELIDLIRDQMRDGALGKWLFYILNIVQTPDNSNLKNAEAMKQQLERKRNDGALDAALIETIDCSKTKDVEDRLMIPMLDILSQNLAAIDNGLMQKADQSGRELYAVFFRFLKDLQNALVKDLRTDGNLNLKINELFDEFYDNHLLGALKEKCRKMYEDRNNDCDVLDKHFQRITTFNPDAKTPSIEKIEKALKRGGAKGQPYHVYAECIADLRTNLTEEFIMIDASLTDIVDDFKKSIVEILANEPRLGFIYPVDESKHPKEWLLDFSNEALSGLEQLRFAFMFLYNFELSVRGFLMHKIRKHTDVLDPELPDQVPQLGSQSAQAIRAELRKRLTILRDSLKRELRNFTQDPNETFYAVMKEFYDRLAYAPNTENQWRRLYYDNYAVVWKQEIHAIADIQIAFDEWQKYIEEVKHFNDREQFTIIS